MDIHKNKRHRIIFKYFLMSFVLLGIERPGFGGSPSALIRSQAQPFRPSSITRGSQKKNATAYVPNELIVKMRGSNHGMFGRLSTRVSSLFVENQVSVPALFRSSGALLVRVSAPAQGGIYASSVSKSILELKRKLSLLPEVEYVEFNTYVRALGEVNPKPNPIFNKREIAAKQNLGPMGFPAFNDPLWPEQVGLFPRSSGDRRFDIEIDTPWGLMAQATEVPVGIIDTGVDYNHEDLKDRFWSNPGETGIDSQGRSKSENGIDDDGNGFIDDYRGWDFVSQDNDPMDDNGHGTHCAGTIGAIGQNGVGIVGMNWNSRLYPIKFLDDRGFGTVANSALAIEYAAQLGIPVLNNSWGGDEYSETVLAALRFANERNVLFVVAAGNESSDNDSAPIYPASYVVDNVLPVAALDSENNVAGFSNFGSKTVAIAAPGVGILSTLPQHGYGPMDGTSMAAPFVAGAASILKAVFPHFDALAIKSRLLAISVMEPALNDQVLFGRLAVARLLEPRFKAPIFDPQLKIEKRGRSFVDVEFNSQILFRSYEIRWGEEALSTDDDWQKASIIQSGRLKSGLAQVGQSLSGFPVNSKGFLSLRLMDDLGNWTPVQTPVPFELLPQKSIYSNPDNSDESVTFRGGWGLENLAGHGIVFSDSPGDVYGYDQLNDFQLPPMTIKSPEPVLQFESKYEYEAGYDYGEVSISQNAGHSWTVVKTVTGIQGWHRVVLPLKDHLTEGKESLLIRFRTLSDRTGSKDGWYLSHIELWD